MAEGCASTGCRGSSSMPIWPTSSWSSPVTETESLQSLRWMRAGRASASNASPPSMRPRRLFTVSFDDVAVADDGQLCEPGPRAQGLAERVLTLGVVATACDATGATERALERTVEYAKERTQFDKPIGSFQAVKHHCADMAIIVEASRAATRAAAEALRRSRRVGDERSDHDFLRRPGVLTSCALALLVHGGIGFTWEHDSHLVLKRVKLDEVLFGTPSVAPAAVGRRRVPGADSHMKGMSPRREGERPGLHGPNGLRTARRFAGGRAVRGANTNDTEREGQMSETWTGRKPRTLDEDTIAEVRRRIGIPVGVLAASAQRGVLHGLLSALRPRLRRWQPALQRPGLRSVNVVGHAHRPAAVPGRVGHQPARGPVLRREGAAEGGRPTRRHRAIHVRRTLAVPQAHPGC